MSGALFPLERRGYLRAVFLTAVGLPLLAVVLFLFFCGFNTLEATHFDTQHQE